MILLKLFWTFLMIGSVSFGGGYAMIPVIEIEVSKNGWMTTQEFTDVIAIAGMSPGPIATNSAIFVGYHTAGFFGAVFSALGMVLPSLIIILIIASFFKRISDHRLVKSAFYGLRPVITGLIIYAAINFAISNDLIASLSWHTFSLIAIYIAALFGLTFLKLHPLLVIFLSGIAGIIIF